MNMLVDNALSTNKQKPSERVTLLGLDFGSTTCSAL